jgi:hypothetical protein
MNFKTFVFISVAFTIQSVSAQSIAQILGNLPAGKSYTLNRAAAAASANAAWGTPGNKTLFVPVDSSNPPQDSRAGTLFLGNRGIDYRNTAQYQILTDDSGAASVVYDNYNPQLTNPTEIHLRTGGTSDATVLDSIHADNGFIYVISKAIPNLASLNEVAQTAGLTSFLAALTQTGVLEQVSALRNITILAPNNAAFAAAASTLQTLSTQQIAAVLQNHIFPGVVYSTGLQNNTQVRSVAGNNIPVSVNRESNGEFVARFGSTRVVIPADNLGNFGVIHIIDGILVPNPIPSGPVAFPATNNGGTNSTGRSDNANGNRNSIASSAFSDNKVSVASWGAGLTGMTLSLMGLLAL